MFLHHDLLLRLPHHLSHWRKVWESGNYTACWQLRWYGAMHLTRRSSIFSIPCNVNFACPRDSSHTVIHVIHLQPPPCPCLSQGITLEKYTSLREANDSSSSAINAEHTQLPPKIHKNIQMSIPPPRNTRATVWAASLWKGCWRLVAPFPRYVYKIPEMIQTWHKEDSNSSLARIKSAIGCPPLIFL